MDADVAVVGLGAMGSMALWRLAERGASVVGFDLFDPPHTNGSSHGDSRIFRLSAYEGDCYAAIARSALALWHSLGERTGAPLLLLTGLLQSAPAGHAHVELMRSSFVEHGLPFEELSGAEAATRFPAHRFAADDRCFVDPNAGVLRPERAIAAALAAAEATGRATIMRRARVDAVRRAAGFVEVCVGGDVQRVRHVVNATGGWIGELLPAMRPHVTMQRQVQVWLDVAEPQLFTPRRFPVFIRHLPGGVIRYGFPSLDGRTIKVATHHDGATSAHPDDIDRTVSRRDTEPVVRFAGELLAGVTGTVARTAVCFYANSEDGHFAIGSVDAMPWQTILGAASGHGFKFAPALGDIAADLALNGVTEAPIEAFNVRRLLR
jgi:sarcosine oxidase